MTYKMTGTEMRITNPTISQMIECAEYLRENNWKWNPSIDYTPADCTDIYSYGWWTNQSHITKCNRTGNAGYLLEKAWDTVKAYETN